MKLWLAWMEVALQLRQACSRNSTFMWMITVLMAMSVRDDRLGVTSYIRALGLKGKCYQRLLDFFHSPAIDLNRLTRIWARLVLQYFPGIERVKGRLVLIGDGIKIAKAGKKMPGVKTLHQESENNNKGEYILGHSCQSISILSRALGGFFAIPLVSRIHEGFLFEINKSLTLLDKMILLLDSLGLQQACYFVADAYYASGKIIKGLLAKDHHLITRVKPNAVAYLPAVTKTRRWGAGRRKKYGTKVHLSWIFEYPEKFAIAVSPAYGEKNVKLKYRATKLLWKPAGIKVLFVCVIHPTRGTIILLSTDLTLEPLEVIRIYSLRFKIELGFKNSVHVLGAYSYRFWMSNMKRTKKGDLDAKLYHESEEYQNSVKRKIRAYHVHMQLGLIAQGLLQYISSQFSELVWKSFGSWLRTIRDGVPPSELVTSMAMRNALPEFLIDRIQHPILKKFLWDNIDFERTEGMRLAA